MAVKREIALDTETTGLDPKSGHRIVEIGCVELINDLPTENNFHVYVNPERDMPKEAERIHGISEEFLKDKPKFHEIVKDFLAFIGDDKLVIHNAKFDMKFINYELKRVRKKEIHMLRAIDTLEIARNKFRGSPVNLNALCKRFNIDISKRTKHGALLDAELLSNVYTELMGGRQVSLGLAGDPSQENGKATNSPGHNQEKLTNIIKEKRHFGISEEEKTAHEKLITSIDNALWNEYEES